MLRFARNDKSKHPLRFLISAGPTREFLDPVRFLSNPSSGRMGIALAHAAARLGHRVSLVHGPCSVRIPRSSLVQSHPVTTCLEMRRAMLKHFSEADVVVMASAVSDFRPRHGSARKIKKTAPGASVLQLVRNPDILAQMGKRKTHQYLVGFSAETHKLLANAAAKLRAKNLDCIVVNRVGGSEGAFGSLSNKVSVLCRDGKIHVFPRQSKKQLALRLIHVFLARTRS